MRSISSGAGVSILLTPTISGDANLDGKVDINDLTIVLANYGKTSGVSWATGDFNGDAKVDINDLTIVLANYGQTQDQRPPAAGLAAVPEPTTLVLIGVAALIPSPARACGEARPAGPKKPNVTASFRRPAD